MSNLAQFVSSALSVDTVRVMIPSIPDVEQYFLKRSLFHKMAPDGNSYRESESLYLWGVEEFDSLPSGWTPPALFYSGEKLFIQFSLPKIIYGHSARLATLDQLLPVLYAIAEVLARDWNVPVPLEPERWQVNRIDIAYNFDCSSRAVAESVYGQLSRLKSPWGKLGVSKGRDRLAYWPSRSRTFKFYLKYDEMMRNADDYGGIDFVKSLGVDNVLRYEEEWHQQFLKRLLKTKSASDVTVEKLISVAQSRRPPSEFFRLLDRQFIRRGVVSSITEAKLKIKSLPKYNQYVDFLDLIIDIGIEAVRLSPEFKDNRKKFYRYNKKLRDIGVIPELFDTSLDDPFNRHSFKVSEHLHTLFTGADNLTCIHDPLIRKIRKYYYKTLENPHFAVV